MKIMPYNSHNTAEGNPIPNNKPFASGHDSRRNTNGRPPKLKTILAGHGLTPAQAYELINELMMLNENELNVLANDSTATIIETTIAAALLKGKAKGSMYALELVLNRTLGLPKAAQEITLQDKRIEVSLELT